MSGHFSVRRLPHRLLAPDRGLILVTIGNEPADADTILIQTSTLLFRQNGLEVAVVGPGDNVELKPVAAGRNLGTEIEILKGLTPSEPVIDTPPDSIAADDSSTYPAL